MSNSQLEEELKKKLELKPEEDDDQNFIRKDKPQEEKSEEKKPEEKENSQQGIFEKIKNFVFPKNNQQRNLDKETGGLEAEKPKENSDKDIWDDRSEEVDKMGSTNVFNSTGMRSVVWKEKKKRLNAAKKAVEAAGITESLRKNITPENGAGNNQGYVSRLKNLRQDRSTANDDHGR